MSESQPNPLEDKESEAVLRQSMGAKYDRGEPTKDKGPDRAGRLLDSYNPRGPGQPSPPHCLRAYQPSQEENLDFFHMQTHRSTGIHMPSG